MRALYMPERGGARTRVVVVTAPTRTAGCVRQPAAHVPGPGGLKTGHHHSPETAQLAGLYVVEVTAARDGPPSDGAYHRCSLAV